MAEPKPASKIPRQGIVYLVLCVVVITLFVLGGVIPTSNRAKGLDAKIVDAKFRLHEQQTLLPVFQYLKTESEKKLGETLPMPVKAGLPRAKIIPSPATF